MSPVGGDSITITGKYGKRGTPYNDNHTAVDIRNAEGADVLSTELGKVLSVGATKNGTTYVWVEGSTTGNRVGYFHTTAAEGIKSGATINAGQLIGTTDLSGRSNAPHLHFVTQTGAARSTRYNPVTYFETNAPSLTINYK